MLHHAVFIAVALCESYNQVMEVLNFFFFYCFVSLISIVLSYQFLKLQLIKIKIFKNQINKPNASEC